MPLFAVASSVGLLHVLLVLIIFAIIAAIVFYVLGLFLPRRIPQLGALVVGIIALIYLFDYLA